MPNKKISQIVSIPWLIILEVFMVVAKYSFAPAIPWGLVLMPIWLPVVLLSFFIIILLLIAFILALAGIEPNK